MNQYNISEKSVMSNTSHPWLSVPCGRCFQFQHLQCWTKHLWWIYILPTALGSNAFFQYTEVHPSYNRVLVKFLSTPFFPIKTELFFVEFSLNQNQKSKAVFAQAAAIHEKNAALHSLQLCFRLFHSCKILFHVIINCCPVFSASDEPTDTLICPSAWTSWLVFHCLTAIYTSLLTPLVLNASFSLNTDKCLGCYTDFKSSGANVKFVFFG